MLLYIIGMACLTNLWINSEPTIKFREIYFKKNTFIKRLLECALCSGFWFFLLYMLIFHQTFAIFGAAISSVLAEFINRKLNKLNI